MYRAILIVILLIGIYSLNAEGQKERNFKVSGGYSLSFISNYDSKFGNEQKSRNYDVKISSGYSISWISEYNSNASLDYDYEFPNNSYIGISIILSKHVPFLIEPGISYVTRNWKVGYYENVGASAADPKYIRERWELSYFDIYCKFKYDVDFNNTVSEKMLKFTPYLGISNSVLFKSKKEYIAKHPESVNSRFNYYHNGNLDMINLFVLMGIDINFKNNYSVGIGYNIGLINLNERNLNIAIPVNDKSYLHTINFTLEVLFK